MDTSCPVTALVGELEGFNNNIRKLEEELQVAQTKLEELKAQKKRKIKEVMEKLVEEDDQPKKKIICSSLPQTNNWVNSTRPKNALLSSSAANSSFAGSPSSADPFSSSSSTACNAGFSSSAESSDDDLGYSSHSSVSKTQDIYVAGDIPFLEGNCCTAELTGENWEAMAIHFTKPGDSTFDESLSGIVAAFVNGPVSMEVESPAAAADPLEVMPPSFPYICSRVFEEGKRKGKTCSSMISDPKSREAHEKKSHNQKKCKYCQEYFFNTHEKYSIKDHWEQEHGKKKCYCNPKARNKMVNLDHPPCKVDGLD
jgi:hypothetical protein